MRVKAVKLMLAVVLGTAFFNLAPLAFAQEQNQGGKAEPRGGGAGGDKKKTSKIDFEDELVEGELKKPELFYLLQKKQFNFKRLIKLREDFLPEMRRDADEVRRSRSK